MCMHSRVRTTLRDFCWTWLKYAKLKACHFFEFIRISMKDEQYAALNVIKVTSGSYHTKCIEKHLKHAEA